MIDERGSVLVIVAVSAVTFMALVAMAIDFGNWYVHKRQLQNRVDAAAFATGLAYGTLFKNCAADATGTNNAIRDVANQYAGIGANAFNTSVNDQSKLTVRVNATNIDDPDTFTAGGPCTEHPQPDAGYWVNVAAREADIPSFFTGLGISAVSSIGATARVALTSASTANGMRPFVLEDASAVGCVRATILGVANAVTLSPVSGSTTQWKGTAPNMPTNDAPVTVKVGCGTGVSNYPGSAYLTRVQTGPQPQLTNLQLAPTPSASCTNGNPYFIPRNGSPCQIEVTATVSFASPDDQSVRAQVGTGGAFDLVKGSGNNWAGTFTVNPRSGTGPNGTQPVTIFAKNSPDPDVDFQPIGNTSIQAGRAINQGLIANVEVEHHAGANGDPIGVITVTLRGLDANGIELIENGADCGAGSLQSHFDDGCDGPFKIKTGAGNCTAAVPFDCVGGASLASLTGAYDNRWAPGGTCTPNNWLGDIPANDPRLISVFLTDEIGGSPSGSSAITGFGAFYVTGWDGGPCNTGTIPDDTAAGDIWGHYFKLVLPSADGTPGTTPCKRDDSAACIAVLVR